MSARARVDRPRTSTACRIACRCIALGLLVLALDVLAANHTVQLKLAHQGVPLDGAVPVEFALYETTNGGAPLSTWSADPVPFDDGLLTVDFSTGPDMLDTRALWLEVRITDPGIGTPTVLSPRVALTAVPLAVVAARPAAGSVGAPAIDPDQVQRRVGRQCPAHAPRLSGVSSAGSATTCVADRGIEGINPGLGIDLVGGSLLAMDFVQAQRRSTPHCKLGTTIRQLTVGGTPVCVPDANPLRGLTRVEATCTFPGTLGVETGCAATPRCPATAPVAITGGQSVDCPLANVHASFPVNDSQGQGWLSWILKPDNNVCRPTETVTAFVYCVAGP